MNSGSPIGVKTGYFQGRETNMAKTYQYRPGIYFSITFLATFALWFAGAYVSFQEEHSGLYMALMLPGLLAPFLISLVMIFTSKNAGLKKDFVNRLINIKLIQPRMLPVMLLLMPLTVFGLYHALSFLWGIRVAVSICRGLLVFSGFCASTGSAVAGRKF